jgi:4-amino-4-deoxychorismate lyase
MSGALGSWIDGVAGNLLPGDDRGFNYGDGLFETILVRGGRARFLAAHLARLQHGLRRLGIRFDAFPALQAEIAHAAAGAPPLAVLKIIVTRGSAQRRGYAPRDAGPARRVVTLWTAPPLTNPRAGVELRVAATRIGANPALAGIKHLNRLENVLAAAEVPDDPAFDALLLDAADRVVCGCMSNVCIVKAGAVATPLLDECGVAGVLRGIVIRESAALGIPFEQRHNTLAELAAADEVFITNARIGVVPVRRVGEHSFHMHAVTHRLAQHIEALDA